MRIKSPSASLCSSLIFIAILLGGSFTSWGQAAPTGPAGAVVLIIRHAEKPDSGSGLSDDGKKRANAYPEFFRNFKIAEKSATPNELIATRDSENSQRPRLTIQPLGEALHLPVHADIKNKDFEVLAQSLKRAKRSGQTILVCWHHGSIPGLLLALGADPNRLLPQGRWPENVFGWLIQLRYDQEGRLTDSSVINENLEPSDADTPPPAAR
jgi:hypothetical protein